MHHVFYSDGNATRISWVIQTKDSMTEQSREHVEIYKNKITDLQSKYISLHIGLFWGIGIFKIRNQDSLKINTDEKIMYEHLKNNFNIQDEFIEKRTRFINQLIAQRELKIEFGLVAANKNLAKKLLEAKELKTKNG